jgi:hypothetical protein
MGDNADGGRTRWSPRPGVLLRGDAGDAGDAPRSSNPAEGRSIQAIVGVEFIGVSWS